MKLQHVPNSVYASNLQYMVYSQIDAQFSFTHISSDILTLQCMFFGDMATVLPESHLIVSAATN